MSFLSYIHPVGDCLYLEMDERKEEMRGKIIMPETRHQRCELGTVQAIGEEVNLEGTNYEAGERVMVAYYAGIHIQLPETIGQESLHRIVRKHEILAKIGE